MRNIKSDHEKFIEIFKAISWLDDKKWRKQEIKRPDSFYEYVLNVNELQPAQKVLAHWLIYITNRLKRADKLWEDNVPVIRDLVIKYYNRDLSTKEQIAEICRKYEERIKALPADLESIKRTLILLLDYDKDIIKFMTRKLSRWADECPGEIYPRIAFSLYLLSYKDVQSLAKKPTSRDENRDELIRKREEAKDVLNNDEKFEEEFRGWYRGSQRWHKRIWAALRDYKKYESLTETFVEGIKDRADREVWKRDFTKQMELPGDTWNIIFFDNCIRPIAENMGVSPKGTPPKVVRDLWEKIKSECPESYPEQFDVTFDFAPRMCDEKLCGACLFGTNSAESICIPSEDKYCPVALISCGYVVICSRNQGECIIREGIGKGTCKGLPGYF